MSSRKGLVCALLGLAVLGFAARFAAAGKLDESAVDAARDHLQRHAPKLGLAASDVGEIAVSSVVPSRHNGVTPVYFQQLHQGVPVTGAELIVHLRGSLVTAVNGRTLGELAGLSTVPGVPASAAASAANVVLSQRLGIADAVLSEPRLEVFDRGLIGGPPVPTRLAWFVEATRDDLRRFFWVDAETGPAPPRRSRSCAATAPRRRASRRRSEPAGPSARPARERCRRSEPAARRRNARGTWRARAPSPRPKPCEQPLPWPPQPRFRRRWRWAVRHKRCRR